MIAFHETTWRCRAGRFNKLIDSVDKSKVKAFLKKLSVTAHPLLPSIVGFLGRCKSLCLKVVLILTNKDAVGGYMNDEKSNKKTRVYLIIGLVSAIPFMFIITRIIDFIYRIGEQRVFVRTFFEPSDILSFAGIVLSITATISLAWIVWRQNEKLNDMNTTLQEQNVQISQNALINSSYNFISISLLQTESANVGRFDSPWLDIPQITLNRTAVGGGSGSSYEIKITFFGDAFSNAPICNLDLEDFELSFEYSTGSKTITENFVMDSKFAGTKFQTYKDNEVGADENDYLFTIRCYIPFYYSDQILESPNVKNIEIKMTASYVNLLRVTTKLSHRLCLSEEATKTKGWFKAIENISFIRLGLKNSEK